MLIRVLSRINKLCHFLTNFKQSHIYNLHVCQILSLISTFGPKNDLEFGSCLEYCSTLHFPYYHKCPFGNVKKSVFLGLSPKPMTRPLPQVWFPIANPLAAGSDFFKSDGDPVYPITFQILYRFAYLIFVTFTTGGARVKKKLPGVNFYRFNAKNWQFTV